jgi:hypothetical protein
MKDNFPEVHRTLEIGKFLNHLLMKSGHCHQHMSYEDNVHEKHVCIITC